MLIGLGNIWDIAGDIMQANVILGYEPKLWGCLRFKNVAFTCVGKTEKFGDMFKKIFQFSIIFSWIFRWYATGIICEMFQDASWWSHISTFFIFYI